MRAVGERGSSLRPAPPAQLLTAPPLFRRPSCPAVVSTTGVSALPDNCMLLAGVFFGIGLLINLLRDLLPHKFARFLPIPLVRARGLAGLGRHERCCRGAGSPTPRGAASA